MGARCQSPEPNAWHVDYVAECWVMLPCRTNQEAGFPFTLRVEEENMVASLLQGEEGQRVRLWLAERFTLSDLRR